MNEYIKSVDRIEFSVTNACTGRCKHCSVGGGRLPALYLDGSRAAEVVRKLCALYPVKSVMTFGGEPLLHPDAVCAIQGAAAKAGVPVRQLITNGYFTKDGERMSEVVWRLKESGVNDLLLSADAFHQETIPLKAVKDFALAVMKADIPLRISPAWLVSREDPNPYNKKTLAITEELAALGAPVCEGNVVFPEGNALIYLREYVEGRASVPNPYEEDPRDLHTISVDADGATLGGNVTEKDIYDLIAAYRP